ncbi:cytochrome c oxidase subunit 7A2, mitochondrial-like [Ptychodera flava]|uniref:cytochrome c oxidase subunit 7A2, mitochondrial-like n=1 Tax=Ptychodera flava TaxID=63121 RepID=UPI00396A0DA5
MSYKYNSLTGRLSQTNPQLAYKPEGLKPEVKEKPPVVWAQEPKPKPTLSTLGGDGLMGVRNQVYAKQRFFQRPGNIPIHLRGGRWDAVLYSLTLTACAVGTVWTFYEIYKASMPKKNE